jgi:hypothetical protein
MDHLDSRLRNYPEGWLRGLMGKRFFEWMRAGSSPADAGASPRYSSVA